MCGRAGAVGREIEAPDAASDGIHVDQEAIIAEGVLDIGSIERIDGLRGDWLIDAEGNGREVALLPSTVS